MTYIVLCLIEEMFNPQWLPGGRLLVSVDVDSIAASPPPSFTHFVSPSHPLSSAQEPPVRVIHFLLLWLNRTSVSPSLSLQSGDIQQLVPQTVLKHLLKMFRQVSTRHTFFLSFQTSVVLLSLLCRSLYLSSACLSSFCLHLCLSVTLCFLLTVLLLHTHTNALIHVHTLSYKLG